MSFGISDFVGLANKVRKVLIDAPAPFKDISKELKPLQIGLEEIEVVLPGRVLTGKQKRELDDIASGYDILKELEEVFLKHRQVGIVPESTSQKAERVWIGPKCEEGDTADFAGGVCGLSDRLITRIAHLSASVSTLLEASQSSGHSHSHSMERFPLEVWSQIAKNS